MSWKQQQAKARRRKPIELHQVVVLDNQFDAPLSLAVDALEAMRLVVMAEHAATLDDDAVVDMDQVSDVVDADPRVIEHLERADDLRRQREDVLVRFTFRSLGSDAYEDLLARHPAPEGQTGAWPFNMKTFPAVLVAACHVHYERDDLGNVVRDDAGNPVEGDGMTEEDAAEIFSGAGWSKGDKDALFAAALSVNNTSTVSYSDLGKG